MMEADIRTDRLEALEDRASDLRSRKRMLEEREAELEGNLRQHKSEMEVLSKVEELFKYLLNRMVYQHAESFSEVTSEGLRKIFHDQDLSFRVDVGQRYGKVVLDFITAGEHFEGDTLESFGGGPAAVESLILRLLVVLRAGLSRYLFLDEALASLADVYVPRCGEFLKQLCDRMNVDILLITHNRTFLDYADTAYEASLDEGGWLQVAEMTD